MSQPGSIHKSGYLNAILLSAEALAVIAAIGYQGGLSPVSGAPSDSIVSQATLAPGVVRGEIRIDNQLIAPIHQLGIAGDGTVWAVSNNGILRFDSTEQWAPLGLSQTNIQVDEHTRIAVETDGTLWVLSDNQLSSYDELGWHAYVMPTNILDRVVKDLYLSPQNEIWLSSYDANPDDYDLMLSRFDGQEWNHIIPNTPQFNLPTSNDVFHLYLDGVDTNNIPWVSYGFPTGPVAYYLEGENLVSSPDGLYQAIFESDGSRWTMIPGSRTYSARTFHRSYGPVGICYQLAGETQRCYLTGPLYKEDCERCGVEVDPDVSDAAEFSESQVLFGHMIADYAVAPDHTIWVLSIADYNYMDDPTLHPDPPEEWLSLTHIDGENWQRYDLDHQQVSANNTNLDLSEIWDIEIAPDGSVWAIMGGSAGKLRLS